MPKPYNIPPFSFYWILVLTLSSMIETFGFEWSYSCKRSIYLYFIVPPQIHQFDFGEEAINSGDVVMAVCLVTKGDLPITIEWTFNNKPIDRFDGITTISTNKRGNQITIESVQDYNRGEYKCIAKNKAGVAEFSAFLNVIGTLVKFCLNF